MVFVDGYANRVVRLNPSRAYKAGARAPTLPHTHTHTSAQRTPKSATPTECLLSDTSRYTHSPLTIDNGQVFCASRLNGRNIEMPPNCRVASGRQPINQSRRIHSESRNLCRHCFGDSHIPRWIAGDAISIDSVSR